MTELKSYLFSSFERKRHIKATWWSRPAFLENRAWSRNDVLGFLWEVQSQGDERGRKETWGRMRSKAKWGSTPLAMASQQVSESTGGRKGSKGIYLVPILLLLAAQRACHREYHSHLQVASSGPRDTAHALRELGCGGRTRDSTALGDMKATAGPEYSEQGAERLHQENLRVLTGCSRHTGTKAFSHAGSRPNHTSGISGSYQELPKCPSICQSTLARLFKDRWHFWLQTAKLECFP